MRRKTDKRKANKSIKQGIYSSDILRDKIYQKGDKVYFHLFPYNDPDLIKIFAGEILRSTTNSDFTVEYVVRITNGFEKREALKDFFFNNFFKTAHTSISTPDSDLNESVQMFSFSETELISEIPNNKFKYGEYKTFFKNHADKFLFCVNEAFCFDTYFKAIEYQNKLAVLASCKYLKNIHDITISKHLRQGKSAIYTKTTQLFIDKHKKFILDLIHELGPNFWHFKETKEGLYKFFDDYILHRKMRKNEFNKWRKEKLKYWAQHDLDREKENED
jgi:hypothetical protein